MVRVLGLKQGESSHIQLQSLQPQNPAPPQDKCFVHQTCYTPPSQSYSSIVPWLLPNLDNIICLGLFDPWSLTPEICYVTIFNYILGGFLCWPQMVLFL